jgi:DNA-binding PadR family transcriptional regulator
MHHENMDLGFWYRRLFKAPFGIPRGLAKLVVLNALKEGPAHGYEVAKRMARQCGGLYFPSSGLIYPTLNLLEDMGYVRALPKDNKTVYELTDEGIRYLEAHKEELDLLNKGFVLRKPRKKIAEVMFALKGLAQAVMNSHILSSDERMEAAKKILDEATSKIESLY